MGRIEVEMCRYKWAEMDPAVGRNDTSSVATLFWFVS